MRGFPFRLFILFFCASGTLLILQNAFDSSDHRKAERAVRNYAAGGRTLGALIEKESPGGTWSTEITHGCRGIVRATYDAPAGRYEFDYDVPAHVIHPGNERGRAALDTLSNCVGADGGAPPDGMTH
jgi:hypothetical protein